MERIIKVQITGRSPLLMHRYPLEPVAAVEKKSMAEQAELSAYRDQESKRLYLPGTALQRALVDGATYSKGKGRASLQKVAAACLFVTPINLDLGTSGYEIDSRAVVNPVTKGRIVRHRPMISNWQCEFDLSYDDTLLTPEQCRQVVDDTGSRVGVLDFRPAKKGPFGRFHVTHWEPLS
jgi:hypothetical protein